MRKCERKLATRRVRRLAHRQAQATLLAAPFRRSFAIPAAENAFSRRVPDLVTEELVAVLSRRSSFEFKQLFDIVHENLRARNAASGGEEMLRLRAYEKLQNLVARGAVRKNGKKYKGLPSALASAIAPQNGHLAGVR